MIRLRWAALAFAVGILLLLAGCGGNTQPFNDTPAIGNLFPSSSAAGGSSFTLNITGTGFIQQSKAYWNNTQLTTTFNPNTLQLSASVPASDIATAGVAQVTVVSPSPGGGISNAAAFTINPVQNPVPTMGSLSPSNTPIGILPPNNVLLVNGTSFIQASTVAFNGISRTTNFVNSTQLSVPMNASDVSANLTISVTVSNPTPGGGVSNAASFTVGTGSAIRLKASVMASGGQFSQVVSVGTPGGYASNGQSAAPAMSADGRFVAFHSTATNLVAQGASGSVFVRDTCLGAVNCMPQTIPVDLASDGGAPNARADTRVAINRDGRFVAFASSASNLVPGVFAARSEASVYVRDLCIGANAPAGCVPQTQLVSVGADGNLAAGASSSVSISGDGRFVAFVSSALAALSGDARAGNGIFVRDICVGPTATTACIPQTYSVAAAGEGVLSGDEFSDPAISADGRYLVFTFHDGLAPAASQVLLADTCLGPNAPLACKPSLVRLSVSVDGSDLAGVNSSPSISEDGRFVAFASQAFDPAVKLFLRDTCLGASAVTNCVPGTKLLLENASTPIISSTGRYVSYIATAAQAAGNSATSTGPVYIYDTCLGAAMGCVPQPYPVNGVSVVSNASAFLADATTPASMSSDGSFIAFSTSAAIQGLTLSGQGDVLLSVTPF